MPNRDNFSKPIIRAVALRAGYQCSFPGCGQLTVGPSEESSSAVAIVGIAAHIHAAAAGGRRYLSTMTAEERSGIENAIWLCATHSILIDRDSVTYTADALKRMKSDHEAQIGNQIAKSDKASPKETDLIAIGPDIIATGELSGIDGNKWSVRVDHFVNGDLASLVDFGEKFASLKQMDRFVLVNSIGEGRTISQLPRWFKKDGSIYVDAVVDERFPRCTAQELRWDLNIEDLSKGVSGVDALRQKIQLCLWQDMTERFDKVGSRISDFYALFGTTLWFERLVKLEAVRLACIPYGEGDSALTPFQCVERVSNVQLLDHAPVGVWLRARVGLEVSGLGDRSEEIKLLVKNESMSALSDLEDSTSAPIQGTAIPETEKTTQRAQQDGQD